MASGARYYFANVTMPLASAKQYMLTAQPTLESMKGSLSTSTDVALASNGGVAFAQDQFSSSNSAANVNDGAYGNSSCWISGNQSSFVGVAFNKASTISSLAFGRDNTGAMTDRYQGTYIFQYTTIANPNASTPAADWTFFGGFYLDSVYPNTTNNYRHVYTFAPISGVTGVRIEVNSDWYVSSFASGGGGAIGVGGGFSDPLQVSANSAYNIGIDGWRSTPPRCRSLARLPSCSPVPHACWPSLAVARRSARGTGSARLFGSGAPPATAGFNGFVGNKESFDEIDLPCFRASDLSFLGPFGVCPDDVHQHAAGTEQRRLLAEGHSLSMVRQSRTTSSTAPTDLSPAAPASTTTSTPAITTICCKGARRPFQIPKWRTRA